MTVTVDQALSHLGENLRRLDFMLPWPPTTNNLYRTTGGKRFKTREARAYLDRCAEAFYEQPGIAGARILTPLALDLVLHAPDKRAYDIDNRLKALLDALQHHEVYKNDSQVQALRVHRCTPYPPAGRVAVALLFGADHFH
jgi:crossover junction endodeoxyribonuclease RusA